VFAAGFRCQALPHWTTWASLKAAMVPVMRCRANGRLIFLIKMQDADGAFYYSVYPQDREIRTRRVARNGDPQVVWPKNTALHCGGGGRASAMRVVAAVQASVSAGREQLLGKGAVRVAISDECDWRATASTAVSKIQHFGDDFTHRTNWPGRPVKCSWPTGNTQYQQKLSSGFPIRPTQRRFAGALGADV